MTALKRKSNGSVSVSTKRARVGSIDAPFARAKLEALTKVELIDRVVALDSELAAIPRQNILSEEDIDENVESTQKVMVSGIQKQMKWTPFRETGGEKFTYEGHAPNKDILLWLFGLPSNHKMKTLQLAIHKFERDVACEWGRANAGPSCVHFTGEHINISLAPEKGTFELSGSYGR